MAGYSIFRGPNRRQPETVNLPVAGAYTPGILVVSDGSQLTQAVVADATNELHVLSNVEFSTQTIATAYTSGDTGIAYSPVPGDMYQCQVAAATYAVGDALTLNASGQLVGAGLDQPIVAYCQEAGTFTAGQLMDVSIANRVRSAPS